MHDEYDYEKAEHKKVLAVFGVPCSCDAPTCRVCVQEALLHAYRDPHPASVVSAKLSTLISPPPCGYTLYEGVGEPVFRPSHLPASKYMPTLYRLKCTPWGLSQARSRLPDWMGRGDLVDLLNANGLNEPRAYRCKKIESYSEHTQYIHDNYVRGPIDIRSYGKSRELWRPQEAMHWNKTATYEDQFERQFPWLAADKGDSGCEWNWDIRGWWDKSHNDRFKVDGQWKSATDAFSAEHDPCREWVTLADGRVISTRCSFCVGLHGLPAPWSVWKEIQLDIPPCFARMPEDIAIAFAEQLWQLRGRLQGVEVLKEDRIAERKSWSSYSCFSSSTFPANQIQLLKRTPQSLSGPMFCSALLLI